jgi:ubiquinone/menaquinone biosynthesis C-methylase UbiE
MPSFEHKIQRAWEADPIREVWPDGRDMRFILGHINEAVVNRTAADGPSGRLLEVAAAEAVHACKLAKAGFDTFVLEPSPVMLERARVWMAHYAVELTLVQGICEKLPFADASFAHVLCDSAIDHFAAPDQGIREMARVLKPGGTLIVSFVNYGSLTVRASRVLYRIERALRPSARDEDRFWDSPVPVEHVFECTVPILHGMCRQYLEHDETFGLSIGWGFPGWSRLLDRLSEARAGKWLRRLNRLAHRRPGYADFVVSVWRRGDAPPRPIPPGRVQPSTPNFNGDRPPIPLDALRITPGDPLYARALEGEQHYPHDWVLAVDTELTAAWERFVHRSVTGDPTRSWLDAVIARGPFGDAVMLGVDGTLPAARWMQARASRRLDVLDVTQSQLDRVATAVAAANGDLSAVRLMRTDLNFVRLPVAAYDVIVSSGTLHHLQNIEHVLDEIHRALRPGGLFVLHDFVGERRHQYTDHRLTLVNGLLAEIPDVYKLDPSRVVERGEPYLMSPFCGLRSDEIIDLVRARFDILVEKRFGYIAPLPIMLDLRRVENEAPEILERLQAEEQKAAADPELLPFGVFIVARR